MCTQLLICWLRVCRSQFAAQVSSLVWLQQVLSPSSWAHALLPTCKGGSTPEFLSAIQPCPRFAACIICYTNHRFMFIAWVFTMGQSSYWYSASMCMFFLEWVNDTTLYGSSWCYMALQASYCSLNWKFHWFRGCLVARRAATATAWFQLKLRPP